MATVPDATPQERALLRYDNGAVALHWIAAALILTQIWVGWTFHEMERGPARGEWFTWHKTLGVVILLLGLARLGWRLGHKPPPYPESLPRWERLAATWNHRLFYALIIGLPLTGLAAVSGGAQEATTGLVGGIPFPLIPGLSEELGDGAGDVHEVLVKLTLALLAIHVLAALKHQFVDPSRVAGRMPPFRAPGHESAHPRDGTE